MEIKSVSYTLDGRKMLVNGETEMRYDAPGEDGEKLRAWLNDPGNKVTTPKESLPHMKRIARAAVEVAYSERLTAAADGATAAEMLSWPAKEAAARRTLKGDAAPKGILAEAKARGDKTSSFVELVVSRADAYEEAVGAASAWKREQITALNGVSTVEEIDEFVANLKTE